MEIEQNRILSTAMPLNEGGEEGNKKNMDQLNENQRQRNNQRTNSPISAVLKQGH